MSAMKRLFQIMADKKASDIFLSVGAVVLAKRKLPGDESVSQENLA